MIDHKIQNSIGMSKFTSVILQLNFTLRMIVCSLNANSIQLLECILDCLKILNVVYLFAVNAEFNVFAIDVLSPELLVPAKQAYNR